MLHNIFPNIKMKLAHPHRQSSILYTSDIIALTLFVTEIKKSIVYYLFVYYFVIVCLISVLLLLPYCSKGHAPLLFSLGGWCLTSYSCLVLPLLISANYKYPVRWLRRLIFNLLCKWV